jgi:hypothetical protein
MRLAQPNGYRNVVGNCISAQHLLPPPPPPTSPNDIDELNNRSYYAAWKTMEETRPHG